MPKITVIISAWKDRGWLSEAILSAKNQTFVDYEIILSSDGNESLKAFADKYKLIWVYSPKKNHSNALNNAVKAAQGEWIKELHDDDLLIDGCIEDLYNAKADADLVYGNAFVFRNKTCLPVAIGPSKIEFKDLFPIKQVSINAATIFFKRDVFLATGGFDIQVITMEDYEFYLNLLSKGYKFKYCNEIVAAYRRHSAQQHMVFKDIHVKEVEYIHNKYKNFLT